MLTSPESSHHSVAVLRLSIAALALSAAALVALPSPPFVESSWEWAPGLVQAIGNITAWGACLLALAMSWRQPSHPAAPSLALFLTLGALSYGLLSAPAVPESSSFHIFGERLRMGTGLSASILAMTALARFSVNFPRALQPDDRYRIERIRARSLTARLYLFPWVAWEVGLLTALALVLAAVAGVTEQLLSLIPLLPASVILLEMSPQYVRLGYRLSEGENRQRALWVVEGFILAPIVWGFGLLLMLVQYPLDMDLKVMWTLSPALAALVFVACLAIGIFGFGALDPALAIRRTVIYGALGIMAVFLFAIIEELISGPIVTRLGLPGTLGSAIAAGVVAIAFTALRSVSIRIARRFVPADLWE